MSGFFDDNSAGNDQSPGSGQPSGDTSGRPIDGTDGVFGAAKGFMDGVNSMQKGAERMVQIAKSGGFRADPEGVKQLINVCDNMFDKLENKSNTFARLAEHPQLGSSPYAETVAHHVRNSADGTQGVIPQIDTFKRTLLALNEALYRASGQYTEADETAKMRHDASS